MAETAFLDAVAAFLRGAGLVPAPATVGVAEPDDAPSLPALVLSLEETRRLGPGLGERSTLVTDRALPWRETISLDDPVIDDEPEPLHLISNDRRSLILPHGGLVRRTLGPGALDGQDIVVTVNGHGLLLAPPVPGPGSGEFSVDATVGKITFGDPLPAPPGTIVVDYHLGQWEQRTVRIAGVLRLDACAATGDGAARLSDAAVGALLAERARTGAGVRGLRAIAVTALGSVGGKEAALANLRRRTARFLFEFEQEIDRPDSSGGVIREVESRMKLPREGAPEGGPQPDVTFFVRRAP